MAVQKPYIVMAAHPVNGHVQPVRLVASELVKLGYEITVLLPRAYEASFTKLPLTFVALTGIADYTEKDFDTLQPERKYWPPGLEQMAYRSIAPTRAIFRQARALQGILQKQKDKEPERPIVLVQESWWRGSEPMQLRIPGLITVPVIALGVTPFLLPSADFPPWGVRAFPDPTPEGRAKALAMIRHMSPVFERPQREFRWVLEDLGLEEGKKIPHLAERFQLPEAHLQMCIPSLEFPRSDMPPNVKFIGGVWKSDVDVWAEKPEWWAREIEGAGAEGEGKKDIIALTQGTMDLDYTELIIPAIEALSDRPNTTVVVILGWRGAKLPDEIKIPPHIHVLDYVPYGEILPHATLFLTNGGYNGVQQALSHGVPILKAGNDGDKIMTGNRIEWAGCALDLWNTRPTPSQVREGVETVLGDPKYKARAMELKEESTRYDPISLIVEEIEIQAEKVRDGVPLPAPTWKSFLGYGEPIDGDAKEGDDKDKEGDVKN